ncbi:MAG: response regulator transcription factor [Lachnospiraceae bacterium]|nr:response regulator transcription factor [Lachnospiraceae bacterium]
MIEIAVCDDDVNELDTTAEILHEIFKSRNLECNIKSFLSASELLKSTKKIDIGILDIAMNEINGIKLGRKLKEKFPQVILIYTTSYEEYCMQAINDVHAFSFLCKPLDRQKLYEQIGQALNMMPDDTLEKQFYKVTDSRNKQYVSIKLKLQDILYFEYIKRQRRVAIVLAEETYEYECVFETLVKEMEQYDFAVNCRGYLVNLCHIAKIKGYVLYLDNGQELPIAQKRMEGFRLKINTFLQSNL